MAGIFGIIKKKGNIQSREIEMINFMQSKNYYSSDQKKQIKEEIKSIFGNICPINHKVNDHFQYAKMIGISCVVDGNVFVNDDAKKLIINKYNIDSNKSDYFYLPFLYDIYRESIVFHLTGLYNIYFYNNIDHSSLLINDRFGYLPLFVYENGEEFVFSSKIVSIITSGVLSKIEIDYTSIAEHLFFHYTLSDSTYIKKIKTLSNAQRVIFSSKEIYKNSYWSVDEFFGYDKLNKSHSKGLFDQSLKSSILKFISHIPGKMNISLTGGWDSRVVLSYLLPKYKDILNLYSFGTQISDDITIPHEIAKSESLNYTPFILDNEYLAHNFITNAKNTILFSNGTRNFKRSHYLYAIKEMAEKSEYFISGIFGDEVMKVGKPMGGEVLSSYTINLIESCFKFESTLDSLKKSNILEIFPVDSNDVIAELSARLESLQRIFNHYETMSQKYVAFRFELNLRKYFGAEINCYNDFAYSYSPFIDYDFLRNYSKTIYFCGNYGMKKNSIAIKKQTTNLYADIVNINYPGLAKYPTSRGYSMNDVNSIKGNIKILYNKYFHKKKQEDAFNTNPTNAIFLSLLENNSIDEKYMGFRNLDILRLEDLYSLTFWINEILK